MEKRIGLWPLAAAILLTIAVFLAFPPFFGFMDDLTYVRTAQGIQAEGLFAYMSHWLPADYSASGRFRPFLPIMAWAFYGPFGLHYLPLHIVNGIFNLLLLALFAWAYLRVWRLVYPEQIKCVVSFAALFFLAELAFPWSHLMIALPALQEKIIFLAALAALLGFTSQRVASWPWLARVPLLAALVALGTFTRESFILFYPPLLAASWAKENRKRFPTETAVYLLVMLALIGLVWWLGRGNAYKSKFSLETLSLTIQNSRSIWIFLGLALLSLGVSLKGSRTIFQGLARAFPAASLAGFVLLMAPWGVGGYLNTVAAPLFAACALTLAPLLPAAARRNSALHAFAALVLLLFAAELAIDATTKQDVKKALESAAMKDIATSNILYAPCDEGADHLRAYATKFFGYKLQVEVPPLLPELRTKLAGAPSYWFVGKHLSCWPGDFDPYALVREGKAEVVWEGAHRWSHRILKIH